MALWHCKVLSLIKIIVLPVCERFNETVRTEVAERVEGEDETVVL